MDGAIGGFYVRLILVGLVYARIDDGHVCFLTGMCVMP